MTTPRHARAAGALYLVIIACGLFAEVVVRGRLIEPNDPSATAANILGDTMLFRLGFAADVVMFLCDVALAVILFRLLEPLSRTLALLTAAFRLTQTAVIGLNALDMFSALRILDGGQALDGFDRDQAASLALLHLDAHAYGYVLGLTFFGVSTLVLGWLAWSSRAVPRPLGVLLALAGVGYVTDSALFFLVPGYDGSASPVVLAPALVAEVWFCLWLLTRGRSLERLADTPAVARDEAGRERRLVATPA